MTTFPPAQPHGPIQALTERLYVVRGAMRMNPVLRISRNMVIIRHGDDLTLVNPIRLDADGENALRELGMVKRILRLGAFHGIDDPWYKHRFEGVELWGQPGGTTYPEPPLDHPLEAGTVLPFPDADLFCFNGTTQPEAALLIHDSPAILVTCDAVQHYGDYTHNNLMARLAMPFIGFPKTTVLGPFWLKMMLPRGRFPARRVRPSPGAGFRRHHRRPRHLPAVRRQGRRTASGGQGIRRSGRTSGRCIVILTVCNPVRKHLKRQQFAFDNLNSAGFFEFPTAFCVI